MTGSNLIENQNVKTADWELDFYSRPVIEADGKKRWELLITSTEDLSGEKPFRWEKICPASEVNSLWLTEAIKEALTDAKSQGWEYPSKLRCWRTSMKTMVKKAAEKNNIEIISSRRTYSLIEWINQREKDIYPKEKGYIAGPFAPTLTTPIINQLIPLPEEARGDSWSFASLSIGSLREAEEWPIEFEGLIPIKDSIDNQINIPGIRLFSENRSLAIAAWLGGLEPVKLLLEKNQLILEAGQSGRWLVTDLEKDAADDIKINMENSKKHADGLQFISIQSKPEDRFFNGFWLLKDINIC